MSRKSTPDHFWNMVNKTRGCWEWTGATNSTGYGTLSYQGKHATAHRVSAFLSGLIGSISAPKNRKESGFILHSCDNRKCCNPKHMRVGTYAENQKDAYTKRRREQPKGGHHANAKLTNAQAEIVRSLYSEGKTQMFLANKFNISQRAISLIVRNESYL